ncbi:MAG: nitrous oxide-stimulated promoter family protein [bacterium]|nr:nitrous oxide-stimulated promoter family protein [bacterium]
MNHYTRRLRRERKTVKAMLAMYCKEHHGKGKELCDECQELDEYADYRLDRCPFEVNKPTCVNCPVHCYKPEPREQMRVVMRFAGPRMLWRHPILAIWHLLDGRREAARP